MQRRYCSFSPLRHFGRLIDWYFGPTPVLERVGLDPLGIARDLLRSFLARSLLK
jgi:hypothetical protein